MTESAVAKRAPYFLPGPGQAQTPASLTCKSEQNPLPRVTLGDLPSAVSVAGPANFDPTILIAPVTDNDLTGIDARSVRVFRADTEAKSLSLVQSSGLATGLGYVWALVDRPGIYVSIGLPRDPLVRRLLFELATRRVSEPSTDPTRMHALTRTHLIAPLDDTAPDSIPAQREQAAAAELATSIDPLTLSAAERGRGAGILPHRLPRGMDFDNFRQRLGELDTTAGGLPEEQLFAVSEPAAVSTTWKLPWWLIPPSASWWMFHRDAEHSGAVTDSHISKTNVAQLQLRNRIHLDGPIISVPAVVGNKIFVGTGNSRSATAASGGSMYRIDLISGVIEQRYTFDTQKGKGSRQGYAGIACTPAVAYGRIYFSALDGTIRCLDANSLQPIWITDLRHADPTHNQPVTHAVNAVGWSSPLVVNGRVYVGFGESESNTFGFVYALDALAGNVIWATCTNLFPGLTDNVANAIPQSVVGMRPLPPGFTALPDPTSRGAAPWSSCAYDFVSNRIYVGTGNVFSELPPPQPKYSQGCISLDATTGGSALFFQPSVADCYRPDDTDVDVPPGPTIFTRNGHRVLAIGSKCGSFFLLDPNTLQVLTRRQLLPRAGGNGGFEGDAGAPLPLVDSHPVQPDGSKATENFYGVFSTAAVHEGLQRLFVGLGGFNYGSAAPGIDYTTTPFMRALSWNDLSDTWITAVGTDKVQRYVTTVPPMYTTAGESGFSSPVVVNDVVLISTSRPGLYGFDAETGLGLWSAQGFGPPIRDSFTLGTVVFGDYVVVGSAYLGLLIFSL